VKSLRGTGLHDFVLSSCPPGKDEVMKILDGDADVAREVP
jgi:hypothetical protein